MVAEDGASHWQVVGNVPHLLRAESISIGARRDPGVPLKEHAEECNIPVSHAVAYFLHAADGCSLTSSWPECDYRVVISRRAKISLNEITFGSSVFAGSVAMLKFLIGGKNCIKDQLASDKRFQHSNVANLLWCN